MTIFYPIGWIYPNQSGGPSNSIYWLSKALVKRGISVIICSTDKEINTLPLNQWLETEYGKVRYIKTKNYVLLIELIIYSIRTVKQADIVHLTAVFNPLALGLYISAYFSKKTIIWSVRGEFDEQALKFSSIKKRLFLIVIKKFLSSKVYFHATSPHEVECIRTQLGNKIKVIHIPNYLELPQKIVAKKNSLSGDYLLFIGRIHAIKALEKLIEALSLSRYFKSSSYKFLLAGTGAEDYIQELKEQIVQYGLAEKITFIGHITGDKKQQLLAEARFTFLPSFSENFGNVVVESLAQGTPVVASKGTPWQILNDKQAGFWVENTPSVLADTIDSILDMSPELYEQYRIHAYDLAVNQFDVHKNIQTWIDTYNNVLNEQ